jgi:hypothetical protein
MAVTISGMKTQVKNTCCKLSWSCFSAGKAEKDAHKGHQRDLHSRVKIACKSCESCSPLLQELETKLREYEGAVTSDRELKARSKHIDVRRHTKSYTCKIRDCKGYLSWDDMLDAREKYWGPPGGTKGPTRKERTERLLQLYTNAHLKFLQTHSLQDKLCSDPLDKFTFCINDHVVCEAAFLYVMFLPKKDKKINRIKKKVLKKCGVSVPKPPIQSSSSAEPSTRDNSKFVHACGYIMNCAEHCGGVSAYVNFENTVYIPYPDVGYFYEEYNYFCIRRKLATGQYAAESCFRQAWQYMAKEHNLKLSGGRGAHDKCAVCANADELLRVSDTSGWSPQERDIVMEFRRMHIHQQMKEREYLEKNIIETYELDPLGQPISVLILIDAMTCIKGDTPHRGMENVEESNKVTSRLFGAEVHCGDIHETFLYYVDNMKSGGANVIVQIMREGK